MKGCVFKKKINRLALMKRLMELQLNNIELSADISNPTNQFKMAANDKEIETLETELYQKKSLCAYTDICQEWNRNIWNIHSRSFKSFLTQLGFQIGWGITCALLFNTSWVIIVSPALVCGIYGIIFYRERKGKKKIDKKMEELVLDEL